MVKTTGTSKATNFSNVRVTNLRFIVNLPNEIYLVCRVIMLGRNVPKRWRCTVLVQIFIDAEILCIIPELT